MFKIYNIQRAYAVRFLFASNIWSFSLKVRVKYKPNVQISVQLVQTVFCLDYAKSLSLYQLRLPARNRNTVYMYILTSWKHLSKTLI